MTHPSTDSQVASHHSHHSHSRLHTTECLHQDAEWVVKHGTVEACLQLAGRVCTISFAAECTRKGWHKELGALQVLTFRYIAIIIGIERACLVVYGPVMSCKGRRVEGNELQREPSRISAGISKGLQA